MSWTTIQSSRTRSYTPSSRGSGRGRGRSYRPTINVKSGLSPSTLHEAVPDATTQHISPPRSPGRGRGRASYRWPSDDRRPSLSSNDASPGSATDSASPPRDPGPGGDSSSPPNDIKEPWFSPTDDAPPDTATGHTSPPRDPGRGRGRGPYHSPSDGRGPSLSTHGAPPDPATERSSPPRGLGHGRGASRPLKYPRTSQFTVADANADRFVRNDAFSRGSGRGRGGSYRLTSNTRGPPLIVNDAPPDRIIKEDLLWAQPVEMPSDTTGDSSKSTEIQNLEYVASYNWAESEKPTIIVPGSPREWKENLEIPMTLQPDAGIPIINQNGSKVPSSALLPLMIAADTIGKQVDWPSVDFVTDWNGLRKIMRWIDGTVPKDFRIDLELAGERTVLFDRWESHDREPSNGRSFGVDFMQETTVPARGCEKTGDHNRIVQYEFFGLKFVVRFKVDACLSTAGPDAEKEEAAEATDPALDDFTSALAGVELEPAASVDQENTPLVATKAPTLPLEIIHAGSEVPQENIIELTTRSVNYIDQFDWGYVYPQLYLSGTPHVFIGVHNRGTFSEIRKRNLAAADMAEQRKEAEASLQKLGMVLETIQKMVVAEGCDKRLSLVCEGGELKMYERSSGRDHLPQDIMTRFGSMAVRWD